MISMVKIDEKHNLQHAFCPLIETFLASKRPSSIIPPSDRGCLFLVKSLMIFIM